MSLLDKKVDVWFESGEVLREVTVLSIPAGLGDSWLFLGADDREHAVQSFQSIDECAPLTGGAPKTIAQQASATCLLCGHMEVCYYYKHSGGGCCGKFVPRTSHVG